MHKQRNQISTFEYKKNTPNVVMFGVFKNRTLLEKAISEIIGKGHNTTEISIFQVNQGGILDYERQNASKSVEFALIGAVVGFCFGILWSIFTAVGIVSCCKITFIPSSSPIWSVALMSILWGFLGGVLGGMLGILFPQVKEEDNATFLDAGSLILALNGTEARSASQLEKILQTNHAVRVGSVLSREELDLTTWMKRVA